MITRSGDLQVPAGEEFPVSVACSHLVTCIPRTITDPAAVSRNYQSPTSAAIYLSVMITPTSPVDWLANPPRHVGTHTKAISAISVRLAFSWKYRRWLSSRCPIHPSIRLAILVVLFPPPHVGSIHPSIRQSILHTSRSSLRLDVFVYPAFLLIRGRSLASCPQFQSLHSSLPLLPAGCISNRPPPTIPLLGVSCSVLWLPVASRREEEGPALMEVQSTVHVWRSVLHRC